MNVRNVDVGRVWDCILYICASEEGGDGGSVVSEAISLLAYTLRLQMNVGQHNTWSSSLLIVNLFVYYESRKREPDKTEDVQNVIFFFWGRFRDETLYLGSCWLLKI